MATVHQIVCSELNSQLKAAMASDPSSLSEFGKRYLLSVVAAGVAETVTFPLDLTKTRMQIQGEYKFEAFNQDDALVTIHVRKGGAGEEHAVLWLPVKAIGPIVIVRVIDCWWVPHQ